MCVCVRVCVCSGSVNRSGLVGEWKDSGKYLKATVTTKCEGEGGKHEINSFLYNSLRQMGHAYTHAHMQREREREPEESQPKTVRLYFHFCAFS